MTKELLFCTIPLFSQNADKPISEQPAGKLYKDMYKNTNVGYSVFGSTFFSQKNAVIGSLVEGDDGCVYILNPYSDLSTDTWLKLEKGQKDTLIAKLPQLIYQTESSGGKITDYYARKMVKDDAGKDVTDFTGDDPNLKFVWHDDTLAMVSPELLAIADEDGNWAGYCDYGIKMFALNEKPVTLPEGAKVDKYAMKYLNYSDEEDGCVIKFSRVGDDVYLSGIPSQLDGSWIKGHVDGDRLVFDGVQYIGPNYDTGRHLFWGPTETTSVWDPQYEIEMDSVYFIDKLVFNYDADKKSYASDGQFVISTGKEKASYLKIVTKPELKPLSAVATVPGTPEIKNVPEWNGSYYRIVFNVPGYDEAGDILDLDSLYYNVFYDGNKVTFREEDGYINLTEDMTDIPYSFIDNDDYGYDFQVSGSQHALYIYKEDIKTIGIQSVYRYGGEVKKSDMATVEVVNTTGVDNVLDSGHKEVAGVKYTDLSGRTVENPRHGLYIKTVTYRDGTVESKKEVLK